MLEDRQQAVEITSTPGPIVLYKQMRTLPRNHFAPSLILSIPTEITDKNKNPVAYSLACLALATSRIPSLQSNINEMEQHAEKGKQYGLMLSTHSHFIAFDNPFTPQPFNVSDTVSTVAEMSINRVDIPAYTTGVVKAVKEHTITVEFNNHLDPLIVEAPKSTFTSPKTAVMSTINQILSQLLTTQTASKGELDTAAKILSGFSNQLINQCVDALCQHIIIKFGTLVNAFIQETEDLYHEHPGAPYNIKQKEAIERNLISLVRKASSEAILNTVELIKEVDRERKHVMASAHNSHILGSIEQYSDILQSEIAFLGSLKQLAKSLSEYGKALYAHEELIAHFDTLLPQYRDTDLNTLCEALKLYKTTHHAMMQILLQNLPLLKGIINQKDDILTILAQSVHNSSYANQLNLPKLFNHLFSLEPLVNEHEKMVRVFIDVMCLIRNSANTVEIQNEVEGLWIKLTPFSVPDLLDLQLLKPFLPKHLASLSEFSALSIYIPGYEEEKELGVINKPDLYRLLQSHPKPKFISLQQFGQPGATDVCQICTIIPDNGELDPYYEQLDGESITRCALSHLMQPYLDTLKNTSQAISQKLMQFLLTRIGTAKQVIDVQRMLYPAELREQYIDLLKKQPGLSPQGLFAVPIRQLSFGSTALAKTAYVLRNTPGHADLTVLEETPINHYTKPWFSIIPVDDSSDYPTTYDGKYYIKPADVPHNIYYLEPNSEEKMANQSNGYYFTQGNITLFATRKSLPDIDPIHMLGWGYAFTQDGRIVFTNPQQIDGTLFTDLKDQELSKRTSLIAQRGPLLSVFTQKTNYDGRNAHFGMGLDKSELGKKLAEMIGLDKNPGSAISFATLITCFRINKQTGEHTPYFTAVNAHANAIKVLQFRDGGAVKITNDDAMTQQEFLDLIRRCIPYYHNPSKSRTAFFIALLLIIAGIGSYFLFEYEKWLGIASICISSSIILLFCTNWAQYFCLCLSGNPPKATEFQPMQVPQPSAQVQHVPPANGVNQDLDGLVYGGF